MAEVLLHIRGRDALLFRDGRPFSAEQGSLSARTLPLPLPGTIAGFLRTWLGNSLGWNWTGNGPNKARQVPVRAPLLLRNGQVVLPAPADAVVYQPEGQTEVAVMALRPADLEGGGCDLPEQGLRPLAVSRDVKPRSGYQYWSLDDAAAWLASPDDTGFKPAEVGAPLVEERVHVSVDSARGIAEDGRLFSTRSLSFGEEWSLLARVGAGSSENYTGLHPLGGERRLAHVEAVELSCWPDCPAVLKSALQAQKTGGRVRMQLVTPALFAGGWRPGWLDEQLEGTPPGLDSLRLRLVGAAVKRREPVSGWVLNMRGPKPVRWMAPAGSVYFFEVLSGDPALLAEAGWLQPVSDSADNTADQERKDGYGLAVWGVWEPGRWEAEEE